MTRQRAPGIEKTKLEPVLPLMALDFKRNTPLLSPNVSFFKKQKAAAPTSLQKGAKFVNRTLLLLRTHPTGNQKMHFQGCQEGLGFAACVERLSCKSLLSGTV